MPDGKSQRPRNVPPAVTGDAGGEFQTKIGAHYLLTVLSGDAPRGLTGAIAERVKFQQQAAGFPFDDVIIEAMDADGSPATLEIQAKRTMDFTASDAQFADVVRRAWKAAQKPEFSARRYELAVAIARTSTLIEQSYQDVLTWSRQQLSGVDFRAHLERFATASQARFIAAFRAHLLSAGAPDVDNTLWQIVRRFQILYFDFAATGSSAEDAAHNRARRTLAPDQASQAISLWSSLIAKAATLHATGGTADRASLTRDLTAEHGFSFTLAVTLTATARKLNEAAHHALSDIHEAVGGVRLPRSDLLEQCDRALESVRLLEIVGQPGVGKSAILKQLALRFSRQGALIVLAPGRLPGGGWLSMAAAVDCPVPLDALMSELALTGTATLFVDNADQIDDDGEQLTLRDLVRAATANPAWRIVVTRGPSGDEWRAKLAAETKRLDHSSVLVGEINDTEAAAVAKAIPSVAPLLVAGHPARPIARNLFYLTRLVDGMEVANAEMLCPVSEMDLTRSWWTSGGGRTQMGASARLRVLRTLADRVIERTGATTYRVDDLDVGAVEELVEAHTLRHDRQGATASFRHDVLRDWAVGFLLKEEPERLSSLQLANVIPAALARGIEVMARLALEGDSTTRSWETLLSAVSATHVHGSWRRPVLLALPRSENADALLDRLKAPLFDDDGRYLGEIIRLVMAVDSEPLASILGPGSQPAEIPDTVLMPIGRSWLNLIHWLRLHVGELPTALIPDSGKLFSQWLIIAQSVDPAASSLLECLYNWLIEIEDALHPTPLRRGEQPTGRPLRFPHPREARDELRFIFIALGNLRPDLAEKYLRRLCTRGVRHEDIESILRLPGALPTAAPAALVDFMLAGLLPKPDRDEHSYHRYSLTPFNLHESLFIPAGPERKPFLDLLVAAPQEGLRLIRGLVEHATRWRADCDRLPTIEIAFPSGVRHFHGDATIYLWPRDGMGSGIVASALMALETWAHQQIEAGRSLEGVLEDVFGPNAGSCAFLCVAVDLALSHWTAAKPVVWPLLTSPEVLQCDTYRWSRDISGETAYLGSRRGKTSRTSSDDLSARPSRQMRLLDMLGDYVIHGPEDLCRLVCSTLEPQCQRILSASTSTDTDEEPEIRATARLALRMAERSNWVSRKFRTSDGQDVSTWQYQPSAEENSARTAALTENQADMAEMNMRNRLQRGLTNITAENPKLVAEAITWAQQGPRVLANDDDPAFEKKWRSLAVASAAAIAARDYNGDDWQNVRAWCEPILFEAIGGDGAAIESHGAPAIWHRPAIGILGLIGLYSRSPNDKVLDALLSAASRSDLTVLRVLASHFSTLAQVDERLPRSLIRIAMATAKRPRKRFDESAEEGAAAQTEFETRKQETVETEQAWLGGQIGEPGWPDLPLWPSRPRRRIRLPGNGDGVTPARRERPRRLDFYINDHAIAALIDGLGHLGKAPPSEWVLSLSDHLMAWTLEANNGPENDDAQYDRENRPTEWNTAYFGTIGTLSGLLPFEEVRTHILEPMMRLDEEAFHDAVASFLRGFDTRLSNTTDPSISKPAAVRSLLAARFKAGRRWYWLGERKTFTAEFHLADALNAMFFHLPNFGGPRVYLPSRNERLVGLMPVLTDLVTSAPKSGYLALLFLNLIETYPTMALLSFLSAASEAWASAIGVDPDFWVGKEIGIRVCKWIKLALASATVDRNTAPLSKALDVMVQSGVAQAREVEGLLAARHSGGTSA